MARQSITEWLQGLPIVWLTSNPNGQGAAAAEGGVYDDQLDRLDQAVKQRMPDYCAADALPYVGDNSGLIQGGGESDLTFRARCKAKNDQWALAGTWAELLYQLYFTCGLEAGSAFIVQQNGQAYSLVSNPSVATDPTTILQIDDLGDNPTITYPVPTPWWRFDDRDDLCSRFALVISSPIPTSICPTLRVTFTAAAEGTGTWTFPFDSGGYDVLWSLTTTDSSLPIIAVTAKTATTVTVSASAPFTGYVDVVGWPADGNPFAGVSQSMQNLIALLCNRWKPAKALFMGTIVDVSGVLWGWPIGTEWGQAGLKWGDSLGVRF